LALATCALLSLEHLGAHESCTMQYGSRCSLVVLLSTCTGIPVFGQQYVESEWAANLARELTGSHFDLVRGWVNVEQAGRVLAEVPSADITVPCMKFGIFGHTLFDLVEPCGNVTIPPEGLDFTTTFGEYHVPGGDAIVGELEQVDNAFSKYTAYAVAVCLTLYGLYCLSVPSTRRNFIKSVKEATSGKLSVDEEDQMASPEEREQEEKDKLDPNSDKFICPGNIYRLITVMHPGEVGVVQWGSYVMKAAICAYMQFYLPINILMAVFKQWQFNSIKSPFYFIYNAGSFATQFAALGSVCTLFANKCASVIEKDASAFYYLLSHDEPEGNAEVEAAPASGASKVDPLLAKSDPKAAAAAAAMSKLPKIEVPQWLLTRHEQFWGFLNMLISCVSAVLLMLAMFMKVATFTGDIMNIAVIAVSLYIVFDLDDKVMDSDPKLRPRYRRTVLKQTELLEKDPLWIKRMASFTVFWIKASIPLGLLMIVLVSWKSTSNGLVIGGDPFQK